ncbi:MAG: carbon-nitrogen hydrolase family protein [Acidimicrobiaceae bacterium]|nr:carbon-nitrogen hydrolase family protein [Acidimicrobiaceae bacterium]
MTTPEPFIVAAVQAEPCWLDADAGVEKAVSVIAEAAANNAKLVAFPETWIPGYPHFLWLGPQAWGMQFVPRYHENSLVIGGTGFNRLAQAAADNSINVVIGVSEKDFGSLYMAQFGFGADGEVLFTRRKLKPTHVERALFGEGDGSHLHVDEVDGIGRLGALNCWEHLQPLTKFAMYSQGEQIHVASWPSFCLYRGGAHALGEEVNMAATQMYAVEGSVFTIAATTVTGPAGLELYCETEEQAALLGGGGGGCSRVYAPDGQIISNLLDEHTEGIVYAEIDLSMIPLAKVAADPSGHYSRPDVTRLVLDKRPQPAVQLVGGSGQEPRTSEESNPVADTQRDTDSDNRPQPNPTETGRTP